MRNVASTLPVTVRIYTGGKIWLRMPGTVANLYLKVDDTAGGCTSVRPHLHKTC
ncbi:MAG: hypothetical protein ACRDE5_08485 [Ginsengibacter sp.]